MQRQRVSFWEQQSQLQRHARATLSREEQRGRERGRGSEKASTCVSAVVISSAPSSLLLTRVLKCYRGRCLVRHGDREGKRERKRVLRTAAEWGSVYRDSLCGSLWLSFSVYANFYCASFHWLYDYCPPVLIHMRSA